MTEGVSALSFIAAVLYVGVAAAAVMAGTRAPLRRQFGWHRWAWLAIAFLFLTFAVLRITGFEDWVRGDLRLALFDENTYEQRRSLQKPLFAVVFMLAAGGAAGLFYFVANGVQGRRSFAVILAMGCTGGMLFLLLLRLLSLHSVDQLLYGSFKINWLVDVGMSVAVLGLAVRYRLLAHATSGSLAR
jgi:hypothetical protein